MAGREHVAARAELRPADAMRHAGIVALWISAIAYAASSIAIFWHRLGGDAHAYWVIAHGQSLYGRPPYAPDAYLYSPLFAQVTRPLSVLPWSLFLPLWMAVMVAAFIWLLRPVKTVWSIPLLMLCVREVCLGNITAIIAVAIVLALARPGFWAVPALTKVSLGGLGVLWHVARGEWSSVAKAVGWIIGLSLASAALWPTAWSNWIYFLLHTHSGDDVLLRTAIAAAVVVVAARKGWLAAMPVAILIAYPVFGGLEPFTVLAAIPRLLVATRAADQSRNAAYSLTRARTASLALSQAPESKGG